MFSPRQGADCHRPARRRRCRSLRRVAESFDTLFAHSPNQALKQLHPRAKPSELSNGDPVVARITRFHIGPAQQAVSPPLGLRLRRPVNRVGRRSKSRWRRCLGHSAWRVSVVKTLANERPRRRRRVTVSARFLDRPPRLSHGKCSLGGAYLERTGSEPFDPRLTARRGAQPPGHVATR